MTEERGEPASGGELAGKKHRIVHLRRADLDDPAIAASWHARGYATLGPVEGHDPYQRCPHCSTDERPDCPDCGAGPCLLEKLLGKLLGQVPRKGGIPGG